MYPRTETETQQARTSALLELACEELRDGGNPLSEPFLSQNLINQEERQELARHLAVGALIMAVGLREKRVFRHAVDGAETERSYRILSRILSPWARS